MLPLFCVWTYISQVENNKMLRKTEEEAGRFVLDRNRFPPPSTSTAIAPASFPDLGEAEREFSCLQILRCNGALALIVNFVLRDSIGFS